MRISQLSFNSVCSRYVKAVLIEQGISAVNIHKKLIMLGPKTIKADLRIKNKN